MFAKMTALDFAPSEKGQSHIIHGLPLSDCIAANSGVQSPEFIAV